MPAPITHSSFGDAHFPPGMCGRVRLVGSDRVFEFACGRDTVVLNNSIPSPKEVFIELIREIVEIAVDPRPAWRRRHQSR